MSQQSAYVESVAVSEVNVRSCLPSSIISDSVSWRHHLHSEPELAYSESKTADFIASLLQRFGLTVHRGLAGTGVVGTLQRGSSRRTVAIRADMDALPIQEQTGVPYTSKFSGVMHACGHDGHVAMALAAACACSRLSDLDGIVHFIFQPAEEQGDGARRMIDDGLFRLFPCEAVYALHNRPVLPLGSCVARDGAMMAALASFELEVVGRGCHGAMPQQGIDPILAACQLVSALQSIISRNVGARRGVVSATQIHAGDAFNVIPDKCTIRGTTRWFDDRIGDLIERRVIELAKGIAASFGCETHVDYRRRLPATINDNAKAAFLRAVATAPPLNLTVVDGEPSMGAEDFAFMLEKVPGCYLGLGTGRSDSDHGLHSPRFDFNDDALPLGAGLWVSLVRASLSQA